MDQLLFHGGYISSAAAAVTPEGIKPFPPTGARKQTCAPRSSTATPGSPRRWHAAHRDRLAVPGAFMDANRDAPRRRADVHGDVAARHPPGPVLVAHPLRQPDPLDAASPRSATPAPAARPTRRPAATANADGSTTITSAPSSPPDAPDGNWIQTDAGQGLLRGPAPVQPAAAVLRQVAGRSASSSPRR